MRRHLALALVGMTVFTGCLAGPADAPVGTEPAAAAASPVAAAPGESVSVTYRIRPGEIEGDLAHVYLEFGVYLAERPDDVYSCTDDAPLFDGRYDPTATPLATPAGACRAFDAGRVDLMALDGPTTLGPFNASPTFDGGHTLVVHDVTVVLANGTVATNLADIDFRALTERSEPTGSFGVELSVVKSPPSDAAERWRFAVRTDRFDPDED